MKKASTRLLEQETQTPSPAPDLIPAESSTENLHWDWYSKQGHFMRVNRLRLLCFLAQHKRRFQMGVARCPRFLNCKRRSARGVCRDPSRQIFPYGEEQPEAGIRTRSYRSIHCFMAARRAT